jgi:hypothetical protein
MLSKCANPECSTPFLHLRDGKLFRWDARAVAIHLHHSGADASTKKPNHPVEFFWLCGKCASRMTLVFKEGIGVATRPLGRAHKAAS